MIIETKGLQKSFDGFLALNGADISVPEGSIYGLVGPNGAGKTTLIRHLAGVMRPTAGEVLVNGAPVYENSKVKAEIVHIPDDLWFFPAASIEDMRRFYAGIYPGFSNERFERLREAFPLEEKRPIRRFSKGMQKQAALWLALCCRPSVVLLDEPVDGLDPVMRRTVWSLVLQDVAEYGATVFISSHNLRELEDVCDHVGIMHKGEVVLQRNLAELQSDILKLQVAFESEIPEAMNGFNILHKAQSGRVSEYIIRGKQEEVLAAVRGVNPLLADALPLSLEEIFIYELGGMDYAQIVL